MRILILFFFFLLSVAYGQDEILVHLHASTQLCKTFLVTENLDQKLEEILAYDLSHNGYCLLVKNKKEAALLITANGSNQSLTLKVEGKEGNFVSPPLPLSQRLEEDRRVIHKAHDALCKPLFHQEGIASRRILYTARNKISSDSSKWNAEIWLSDYDGANAKQMTQEQALIVTPMVLPTKTKTVHFFYVSYKEGEPKIFLGNGGKGKRVTYMLGNQFMPTITKQLDRIAFISTVHGKEDLFIQDFSLEKGVMGKAKKIYSSHKATQGTPTFHPNGKEIAFVSNKDGTARIYTMRIPQGNEQPSECPLNLISKKNRDNTSPHWSPDGEKIAYSSLTRGVRQIWIYDMKKREEIQLTFGDTHCENPIWAANSLHLMYNSASSESSELYMIDCNQKRPTKISMGPKDKRFPVWEG